MSDNDNSKFVPPFEKPNAPGTEEAAKVHATFGAMTTANPNFIPPFAPPKKLGTTSLDDVTAVPADNMAEVAEDLATSYTNDNSDKVSSTLEASTGIEAVAAAPKVDQAPQTRSPVGIADPIDEDEMDESRFLAHDACCLKDRTSRQLTPPRYIIQDVLPIGLTVFIMPNDLKAKSFMLAMAKSVETGMPLLGDHAIQKPGDMFYLHDMERDAELTLMQEENLLPEDAAGLWTKMVEKKDAHQKSLNAFNERVETVHTKSVILIDGVLQSYLERTFAEQKVPAVMAGAKSYLEGLKKFGHAHGVSVIVPLYMHRKLEKKIAKEVMTLENRELADTILTIKGNADKGEYRLEVSRRGVHRKTLNMIWTTTGWTMKPAGKRGKPKAGSKPSANDS
ncbi:hypothetical protein [Fundidesulfovibrio soli]|uniref:hypothetical protein n=1 Tax=Fundidesulfovibrio soli TaxID=2922716 RepID=UPI001FAEE05C|nr:hypothetical protein [Fundidesulfovibrio soli]